MVRLAWKPTVLISGLTVANGWASFGGGIYVAGGNLTITGSVLSNNRVSNGWGIGYGSARGAIFVAAGAVSVNNSTLSNNTAFGGNGDDAPYCPFPDMGDDGFPGGPGRGGASTWPQAPRPLVTARCLATKQSAATGAAPSAAVGMGAYISRH